MPLLPPLTKKTSAIDTHLQRKKLGFSNGECGKSPQTPTFSYLELECLNPSSLYGLLKMNKHIANSFTVSISHRTAACGVPAAACNGNNLRRAGTPEKSAQFPLQITCKGFITNQLSARVQLLLGVTKGRKSQWAKPWKEIWGNLIPELWKQFLLSPYLHEHTWVGTPVTNLRGPSGSFCHCYDNISDMRHLKEERLILDPFGGTTHHEEKERRLEQLHAMSAGMWGCSLTSWRISTQSGSDGNWASGSTSSSQELNLVNS